MKKALLLNSLYFPNVGGVENSLSSINKCLSKDGFEVHIIVSDNDQASSSPLPPETVSGGEHIFRYKYKSVVGPIAQIFRAAQLIKKINPDLNYDLIIARSHVSVLAAKLAGLRHINYIIPGVSAYQEKNKLQSGSYRKIISFYLNSFLQRLALSFADRNYVFSNEMLDQIDRFTAKRVDADLIRPGVDSLRFKVPSSHYKKNVRKFLGFEEESLLILCVGRYSLVKGLDYAIKSLVYLEEKYKLVIVGEGPEEQNYHRLINANKLQDRVKLVPKTQFPEKYYWSSDIFMLPSLHEPFGQVLLEATASGLPIVAFSRKAGVETATEEIYSDYQFLASFSDSLDEHSLANSLLSLERKLTSHEFEFFEEQEKFLEQYSWQDLVEKLYKGFDGQVK